MRIENNYNSNSDQYSEISSQNSEETDNDSDNSNPKVTLGCNDNCKKSCCSKTLNVLTKEEEEQSLLIELISKITNPELKTQYMNKLRILFTCNKET